MLFELLAMVVAGFAGAGVVLLANKLLGGMSAEQLLSIADSMESMLIQERE